MNSELIINADNTIYHLNLAPDEVADLVITVGDPDRVAMVSKYFDTVEVRKQHREFITHTGTLRGKRLTVISTGIGTDNIDIVLTELDALVNMDFATLQPKSALRSLQIVRIGTSGALQPDIPVGTFLVSSHGVGYDGLMHFYQFENTREEKEFLGSISQIQMPLVPYFFSADQYLADKFGEGFVKGITATCTGFYGPQGRKVRGVPSDPAFLDKLQAWSFEGNRVTNFEMETAAIYGMAKMLGHQALSVNVILANRPNKVFADDPNPLTELLIASVLERLV